jgi:purine nucleosidase
VLHDPLVTESKESEISMATTADTSAQAAHVTEEHRVRLLSAEPAAPVRMVLDTDARNEIDDQFALVHVLLAPERARLEAVYAAPFCNGRVASPAEGMRESEAEIRRVTGLLPERQVPVLSGSERWLSDAGVPVASAAASDLIERARAGDSPLYVVAIGAPTNVASALLADPGLAGRVVVVWLGGHAPNSGTAAEFNLRQDPAASRVLLDSGVPLVLVPCLGVADRMITTKGEIDRYVRPAGNIGALLADLYDDYVPDEPGRSKVIWDLAATAWVLHRNWLGAEFTTSPILTSGLRWSRDPQRHLILSVTHVGRDQIFGDLFRRLAHAAAVAVAPRRGWTSSDRGLSWK